MYIIRTLLLTEQIPSACCGRYRRRFPTARTALYLVLSPSLQSRTDVCSSFDNNSTEKSSTNSTFESVLQARHQIHCTSP